MTYSYEDIALARKKVAEQVLNDAKRHHQTYYHSPSVSRPLEATLADALFDCGSTACIAGWACMLILPQETRIDSLDWFSEGQEILGLNYENATVLFGSMMDDAAARKAIVWLADNPSASQDAIADRLESLYRQSLNRRDW